MPQDLLPDLQPFAHLAAFQAGDFTPDEQRCISRKIRQLLDEGKEQDQAVAIAISSCAPDKVRGSSVLPGGAYTAVRNPDGTYDVLDVPIMGPIPEGDHDNAVGLDADWMNRAVVRARQRLANDTYLPLLHIRHHVRGGAGSVERGGYFLPRYVRSITYDGQVIPAMFADLKHVPAHVYERIRAGDLPYRSIEVNDLTAQPEVDSLALLPDEVPFFRLPLLTIGKEVGEGRLAAQARPGSEDGKLHEYERGPCRGTFRAHDQAAFLCHLEGTMPKDAKTATALAAKAQDDDDKGDGLEKRVAKLEDGMGEIKSMLTKLTKAKASDDGDDDDSAKAQDDDSAPAEDEEGDKGEGKAKAGAKAQDTEVAALMGRVAALETKDKTRDQEAQVATLIAQARKDLRGYVVPEDLDKSVGLLARKGGQELVDTYVATIKASGQKEPPPDLDDLDDGDVDHLDASDGLPELVLQARSKGPDHFKKTVGAFRTWEQLSGRAGFTMTLEDYLAVNV